MPFGPSYSPFRVTANGTFPLPPSTRLGGILITTNGSMRIARGLTGTGTPIIPAIPVTAGTNFVLPIAIGEDAAIVFGGGASGVVLANP